MSSEFFTDPKSVIRSESQCDSDPTDPPMKNTNSSDSRHECTQSQSRKLLRIDVPSAPQIGCPTQNRVFFSILYVSCNFLEELMGIRKESVEKSKSTSRYGL